MITTANTSSEAGGVILQKWLIEHLTTPDEFLRWAKKQWVFPKRFDFCEYLQAFVRQGTHLNVYVQPHVVGFKDIRILIPVWAYPAIPRCGVYLNKAKMLKVMSQIVEEFNQNLYVELLPNYWRNYQEAYDAEIMYKPPSKDGRWP